MATGIGKDVVYLVHYFNVERDTANAREGKKKRRGTRRSLKGCSSRWLLRSFHQQYYNRRPEADKQAAVGCFMVWRWQNLRNTSEVTSLCDSGCGLTWNLQQVQHSSKPFCIRCVCVCVRACVRAGGGERESERPQQRQTRLYQQYITRGRHNRWNCTIPTNGENMFEKD
jgi:hypothetical protein